MTNELCTHSSRYCEIYFTKSDTFWGSVWRVWIIFEIREIAVFRQVSDICLEECSRHWQKKMQSNFCRKIDFLHVICGQPNETTTLTLWIIDNIGAIMQINKILLNAQINRSSILHNTERFHKNIIYNIYEVMNV